MVLQADILWSTCQIVHGPGNQGRLRLHRPHLLTKQSWMDRVEGAQEVKKPNPRSRFGGVLLTMDPLQHVNDGITCRGSMYVPAWTFNKRGPASQASSTCGSESCRSVVTGVSSIVQGSTRNSVSSALYAVSNFSKVCPSLLFCSSSAPCQLLSPSTSSDRESISTSGGRSSCPVCSTSESSR